MARIERPAAAAIPPLLKDLNERTVLETIRSSAPVSRAEISRLVGISKPTVSLAIQSLVDAGLVREAAEGPDGPSYGAVFFEPVPDAALVLGFDLGCTVPARRDLRSARRGSVPGSTSRSRAATPPACSTSSPGFAISSSRPQGFPTR
jgi:DNA-binding transcriptional ArsR family regulator